MWFYKQCIKHIVELLNKARVRLANLVLFLPTLNFVTVTL